MRTKAILPIIAAAINNGSQMYNSGDIKGCAGLYESVSTQLLTQGVDGYPRLAIEEALSRVVNVDFNEKAWLLRYAFDAIISYADQEENTSYTPTGNDITVMDLLDFANIPDSSSWYGLHDSIMGGVSDGKLLLNDKQEAVFSGVVRVEYNGGFASVRQNVNWDVSGFDGFYLDIRSDDPSRYFSFNFKDEMCSRMGGVNFKKKFRAH
jgi:hypothetical protein